MESSKVLEKDFMTKKDCNGKYVKREAKPAGLFNFGFPSFLLFFPLQFKLGKNVLCKYSVFFLVFSPNKTPHRT